MRRVVFEGPLESPERVDELVEELKANSDAGEESVPGKTSLFESAARVEAFEAVEVARQCPFLLDLVTDLRRGLERGEGKGGVAEGVDGPLEGLGEAADAVEAPDEVVEEGLKADADPLRPHRLWEAWEGADACLEVEATVGPLPLRRRWPSTPA